MSNSYLFFLNYPILNILKPAAMATPLTVPGYRYLVPAQQLGDLGARARTLANLHREAQRGAAQDGAAFFLWRWTVDVFRLVFFEVVLKHKGDFFDSPRFMLIFCDVLVNMLIYADIC